MVHQTGCRLVDQAPPRIFLHALARAEVGDQTFETEQLPGRRKDAAANLGDPLDVAAAVDDLVGQFEPFAASRAHLHAGPHVFAVFGMNQVAETHRAVSHQRSGWIAGEFEATFADELHRPAPVAVAAVDHAGHVVHERAQAAPLRTQAFFVELAPRDVDHHADHGARQGIVGCGGDRASANLHPAQRSLRVQHACFDRRCGAAVSHSFAQSLGHGGAVFGMQQLQQRCAGHVSRVSPRDHRPGGADVGHGQFVVECEQHVAKTRGELVRPRAAGRLHRAFAVCVRAA